MARTLNITQEIGVSIDWRQLANDLIEKFDIEIPEEDIEEFCCENEIKYLTIQDSTQNIEEIHTNDLTGDEEIIERF